MSQEPEFHPYTVHAKLLSKKKKDGKENEECSEVHSPVGIQPPDA